MPRDYYARKLAGRHRFCDIPHMKLTDIFKSLRRRRLRSDISQRSALIRSRSPRSPLSDHDSSPARPFSSDRFTSLSAYHRSDVVGVLSLTEEDCSSGTNTSSSVLEENRYVVGMESPPSPRPAPVFPTSPSVFRLRSASTKDYLVDELEQHLRQLSLGDASPVFKSSTLCDLPICPDVPIDPKTSPRRTFSDSLHIRKPTSSSHNQNVAPMILITSADAKHAKPLPASSQRPPRTPFGPSNSTDHPTNLSSAKSKSPHDDPFRMQSCSSTCPPDPDFTFRLPPFPSTNPSSSEYCSPDTPTPMCCDHFGDCKGDLWEVLHPPLIAGRFTLPPFKLPPMSTGLFDDMSTPLPY